MIWPGSLVNRLPQQAGQRSGTSVWQSRHSRKSQGRAAALRGSILCAFFFMLFGVCFGGLVIQIVFQQLDEVVEIDRLADETRGAGLERRRFIIRIARPNQHRNGLGLW